MRKKRAIKRDVLIDPIYQTKIVTKLINQMMKDGKRGKSQTILYDAFDMISEKTNEDANEVFKKALANVTPALEVKARRVGGSNYQVPIEVNPDRAQALALRWIVQYSRSGNGKTMAERLANELIAAANGTGSAVKKKEDTHKMAEANKAYAHYRW